MAQFFSVQLGSGAVNARTFPVSGVGLGGRTTHSARAEFVVTTAITTADVIDLFDLPPRARVLRGFVKASDMDINAAPTFAFNIGTAAVPALFFAATTAPSTGTIDRFLTFAGTDFVTTGKTRVKLVPSANSATFAAGTIVVLIEFMVEEPA